MTKPTGVGRGGKRKGSGRKARAPGVSVAIPAAPPVGTSAQELAKHYAALAVETLAVIASDGRQPASSRVGAARELLDRSEGKAKPGTMKADQPDLFTDDGWDGLLTSRQPAAGRSN